MSQVSTGLLVEVLLDSAPVAGVVTDVLTPRADWQQAPQLSHPLKGGRKLVGDPPQFHLSDDLSGEAFQCRQLFGLELPRLPIDHAQSSECVSFGAHQQCTGVKPDVRLSRYERIAGKPFVRSRVLNDERAVTEDGVGAESAFPRRLECRNTNPRFEPLALSIQKDHQCHRRLADVGGQPRQIVVRLIRRRIEQPVGVECRKASGLCDRF